MPSGIYLDDITFNFREGPPILEELSLRIERGEFIGIVGSNGSGKSTLARLLNGSLLPTSGDVWIDSWCTTRQRDHALIKQSVGLIGSDAENQFVTSIVFDEITFALQAAHLETSEVMRRGEEMLDRLSLTQYRNVHPFFLSAGEQFRVLLAVVLARQPDYLVLDEIYSMMDSPARQQTLELLLELQLKSGLTIILLTHHLEDLLQANRVVVLEQGKIKMDGPAGSVFQATLRRPEWGIEQPLAHQVYQQIPLDKRHLFPELYVSFNTR